jgi:transmembrane sensor
MSDTPATAQGSIEEQAIAWHLALRDAEASAWDDFVIWLEVDPRHALAYDRVLAASDDIDAVLPGMSVSANDNHIAAKPRRLRWVGAGAGISVAAAAVALFFAQPGRAPDAAFEIVTAPGQQRGIKLVDGTRIALNGGTTVAVDRHNPRLATLRSGEATFSVIHGDKAPFMLSVGTARIEDVGTVFNVVAAGKTVTVDVKEGSVRYMLGSAEVPLRRGQSLTDTGAGGPLVVRAKQADAIASWQTGRLDYDMQSFTVVAQDLSRNLGIPVFADASLAGRQFSGTFQIDRDRTRFFARLGDLLGVKTRRHGKGWQLSAR